MDAEQIRRCLWDREWVYNQVNSCAQTYYTILGDNYDNSTLLFLLRRRVHELWREGRVFIMVLPLTRRGTNVLYTPCKKYNILLDAHASDESVFDMGRTGHYLTYCLFGTRRRGYIVECDRSLVLNGSGWSHSDRRKFNLSSALRYI